jgi:hypothetical protein
MQRCDAVLIGGVDIGARLEQFDNFLALLSGVRIAIAANVE